MAVTVRILHDIAIGDTEHLYVGEVDLDSSYPTGGEAVDVTGNQSFEVLVAQSKAGYVFSWDRANQKLLAYHGDNDNVADGPLVQVPDTTNLSAVTGIQFFAVGS